MRLHPKKDNLPLPPLVVASLNMNSVNDANSKKDTIISIGVAINKTFNMQSSLSPQGLFHESFCCELKIKSVYYSN